MLSLHELNDRSASRHASTWPDRHGAPAGTCVRRKLLLAGVAALGGAACGGCASGAGVVGAIIGPRTTRLKAEFVAARDLNPDVRHRPSPVVVRLYEFKDGTPFSSADFMTVYQRDQADLGSDILAREEFVLQPGERRLVERKVDAAARWLGVFVAYRDIDRAQWRAGAPLETGKLNEWRVDVGAYAVTLAAGGRG